MTNTFAEAPNVIGVLRELTAAAALCWSNEDLPKLGTYDADQAERLADEAMARIGEILGLTGWKGSKLFGTYTIGQGIGEQ
jgi:hypothetical protein